MRHATWNAIATLARQDVGEETANYHACTGDDCMGMWRTSEIFGVASAFSLLQGQTPAADLPDCPECALLVDLALESRAAVLTTHVEAQFDAERHKEAT